MYLNTLIVYFLSLFSLKTSLWPSGGTQYKNPCSRQYGSD